MHSPSAHAILVSIHFNPRPIMVFESSLFRLSCRISFDDRLTAHAHNISTYYTSKTMVDTLMTTVSYAARTLAQTFSSGPT